MKLLILVFAFLICDLAAIAQESSKIDSLNKLKEVLVLQKDAIVDSITAIDFKISELKMEEFRSQNGGIYCETKTWGNTKIWKKPTQSGRAVAPITKGKVVQVYSYEHNYWLISIGSIKGYATDFSLEITPKMEELKNAYYAEVRKDRLLREERESQERRAEDQKRKAEKQERIAEKNRKIDEFGEPTSSKIRAHKYWIGMTKDMAILSRGKPEDVNRTVGSWGVHEQWVYKNRYLYFENGKLTSWQD